QKGSNGSISAENDALKKISILLAWLVWRKSEAGFYHHHLLRGEPQELLLTLVAVEEKHPILVFRRRPNL
ncbi:unnamed protein product, partial [Musa acuminata subsp. burmannicoides]